MKHRTVVAVFAYNHFVDGDPRGTTKVADARLLIP